MSDFFVDLVDFNENVNYGSFVMIFCSYLLLLWLVISVWVGVDAYRRFNNKYKAIGFLILTLVLNFPILIFYFIVRPELRLEDYEEWEAQGVSVPLVNFKGDKGVEMVLELKMHPATMSDAQKDMKIDVSWESPRTDMELVQPKQAVVVQSDVVQNSFPEKSDRKVSNVFSRMGGTVKKKISRVKEISADYASRKRKHDLSKPEEAVIIQNQDHAQKNKDKKRKRKLKKNKKR